MDEHARSARNWFVGCGVDRAAERRGDEGWLAARMADPASAVIPVWRARNLLTQAQPPRAATPPPQALGRYLEGAEPPVLLGVRDARTYFALELPAQDDAAPDSLAAWGYFADLRTAAPLLGREEGALLAYARAMTYWHRRHRFCGDCGRATRSTEAGFLRVCTDPECERRQFPRTDPAVIVLVRGEGRCLLGRPPSWRAGLYSCIAGFVEPGEALEETVMREVLEETGVAVADVRYHSSQPWAFPSSLMLGFTARAAGGEARASDAELEDVRWFTPEELRRGVGAGTLAIPPPISIAYRLIEDWYAGEGAGRLGELVE